MKQQQGIPTRLIWLWVVWGIAVIVAVGIGVVK